MFDDDVILTDRSNRPNHRRVRISPLGHFSLYWMIDIFRLRAIRGGSKVVHSQSVTFCPPQSRKIVHRIKEKKRGNKEKLSAAIKRRELKRKRKKRTRKRVRPIFSFWQPWRFSQIKSFLQRQYQTWINFIWIWKPRRGNWKEERSKEGKETSATSSSSSFSVAVSFVSF